MRSIIQWWVSPALPLGDVWAYLKLESTNPLTALWAHLRAWLIHPIKRRLAKYYLSTLRRFFTITVIGITGSSGKTTTKEMLYSILAQCGSTVASRRNTDSVYEIPSTILRAKPWTKYLILEMGVEIPGEMDFYRWLADVDVAIVTLISKTHIQFFGSEDGVAQEKIKIAKGLTQGKTVVLNGTDPRLVKLAKSLKCKVRWFGKGDNTLVSVDYTHDFKTHAKLKLDGKPLEVTLPGFGEIYATNALGAVVVAHALKVPDSVIKAGLEQFSPPPHRMAVFKVGSGSFVIDDAYNNNPNAAKQSLDMLAKVSRGKDVYMVIGDMRELGDIAHAEHITLADRIAELNPVRLVCVGEYAPVMVDRVRKQLARVVVSDYPTWQEAVGDVLKFPKHNSLIFIKGSRGIALENVVALLKPADLNVTMKK